MEKINVAELLKDCPKGMELDCTIWDSEARVFFQRVLDSNFAYPIEAIVKYNNKEYPASFNKYGAFNAQPYCKCVIFPKGKTTWEEFMPPCEFKDGDILATIRGSIFIYKKIDVYNYCGSYTSLNIHDGFLSTYYSYLKDCSRLATEEEKQKLFDAIKANGYKWNPETKALVKLIEPRFKVGYRIRKENNNSRVYTINGVYSSMYGVEERDFGILIEEQDEWELVPNKFDINTLVPFESRVLVRNTEREMWKPSIWGYYDADNTKYYPYETVGGNCFQLCIPYKGNEYLLGTTNDCDNFYKTWEK